MSDFSSPGFVFRFLPVVLAVYYIVPGRLRRLLLLVASFVFYASGDLRFLPVLVCATLVNYLLGRDSALQRRAVFVLAVLLDAGLLVTCKTLGHIWDSTWIPLGVSFYTFKMISYQVDLYRGEIKGASLIDTANYFALFPQVLMGPIMRYEDYAQCASLNDSALMSRRERFSAHLSQIEEGLFYFAFGLACKVLIADHLAMLWNQLATIGYDALSTPMAWVGAVCYTMNLYYDFWGYSLMAGGVGVMLGFPFIENFHHPYAAKGVADFYRRWHMTLGTWFRDYVYIPLGGSREGEMRTVLNLFTVWIITGIWHGVGWTFLIWGISLWVLIVWEKFALEGKPLLFGILSRFHVWVLIPLTWVVFAMPDLNALSQYFLCLFPVYGMSETAYAEDTVKYLQMYGAYFAAGAVLLIPACFDTLKAHRRHPLVVLLMFALFWAAVYSASNAAGNPFMYLRF